MLFPSPAAGSNQAAPCRDLLGGLELISARSLPMIAQAALNVQVQSLLAAGSSRRSHGADACWRSAVCEGPC